MRLQHSTRRSQGLRHGLLAAVLAGVLPTAVPPALAQEREDKGPGVFASVKWQKGPSTAILGNQAEAKLPDGFIFAGSQDTVRLMEAMQNPTTGREVGFIAPKDMKWFVVFEFDDVGYVKDDEKQALDADAILASLRKGNEAANKERKQRGWSTLEITGWEQKPHYDEQTHNLEWATRARSGRETVVNHNTRLLGRYGVMEATLVIDPEELTKTLPPYKKLLNGFAFTEGNRYAEFRSGDKIAKYGLTALITGGAAAVAIKTGLLPKIWKLLVVGVIAIGAAIRGVFKKLVRRG